MAMPAIVRAPNRSRRRNTVARPTQIGFVVTSAALDATDVYSKELIQVTKWAARKAPATPAISASRDRIRESSSRRIAAASGTRTRLARTIRHAAIAMDETPACWA
jgi:hypothetical protein